MCKLCRMYMAIWCQVWTFVNSKACPLYKHLDTNTSSKNSVYIVQLYGLPVCPKLKIAKSGHRPCRKGLMKFDQKFRFLIFLQLDPEKSIL